MTGPVHLGIAVGLLVGVALFVAVTSGKKGWLQIARVLACAGVFLAGLLVPWQSFRRGAIFQAVAATWRAWEADLANGDDSRH